MTCSCLQAHCSTSRALCLTALALIFCACLDARRTPLEREGTPPMGGEAVEEPRAFIGEGISLGSSGVRRLTSAQLRRSLMDAFGEGLVVPQVSEPDISEGGLISVGAGTTTYSARGIASIEEASYSVAQQVLGDPALKSRAVPCSLEGDPRPCQREALALSGRRLWRRSLSEAELEGLMGVVSRATEVLSDPSEGLAFGFAALIQSPHFLYRAELGQLEEPRVKLEPHALAARLSYLLWDAPPDEALLDAAESGALESDEGLSVALERLLSSPRAREGVARFFTEQLKLYELSEVRKDPLVFERYDAQLMRDARESTLRLLVHLVFEREADLRSLMTTRAHFLNPKLAALYQVPAPSAEGFRLVELPEGSRRAGLLSHASILSLNAHPNSSSATLRGKFVRTVLLCQDIPPPPVGVNTAIPEPSGDTVTLRQRVAEHLENPSCAGCHQLLDPIGLGLENYDSIGQWRSSEQGALIDASGELDQGSFEDPESLGRLIREHPRFAPCLTRTLTRYALGRLEVEREAPFLEDLGDRFERGDYQLKVLLRALVMSPLFREAGAPR